MKNRYHIRALKYLVKLSLLVAFLFVILHFLGNNVTDQLFHTNQGFILLLLVIGLSIVYPIIGYTSRKLAYNLDDHPDELHKVMVLCSYEAEPNTEGRSYRASAPTKKLFLMYEDRVTITNMNGVSVLTGPRKEVVRIAFRLDTFVRESQS